MLSNSVLDELIRVKAERDSLRERLAIVWEPGLVKQIERVLREEEKHPSPSHFSESDRDRILLEAARAYIASVRPKETRP